MILEPINDAACLGKLSRLALTRSGSDAFEALGQEFADTDQLLTAGWSRTKGVQRVVDYQVEQGQTDVTADCVFAAGKSAYAAQVIAGVLTPAQAAAQPQADSDTLDTIIGVLGQLVEKRRDREAVELPADVPHLPWRAKA